MDREFLVRVKKELEDIDQKIDEISSGFDTDYDGEILDILKEKQASLKKMYEELEHKHKKESVWSFLRGKFDFWF